MQWIAPQDLLPAQNVSFMVRKRFVLDCIPTTAILQITADSRYIAHVNGQYIGDGPSARGTDQTYFLDEHDVAALLRKGENELLLRVHCPVTPLTSMVPPVEPAVIAQLGQWAATDQSWEVCIDTAHRSDAPFYTHHIGYSEYRDMRLEPDQWAPARVIDDMGGRAISPRPIDALTNELFSPVRVVDRGGVPPHKPDIESDVEYAALMQMEMHLKPSRLGFDDVDQTTRITPIAAITPLGRMEGAYLIYDFGQELCGNLILDIEGPAGAIVDVGYDEDCPNDRIDPYRVNPNNTLYRFADRYILREGRQQIENRFHSRGMRYLQIVCRRFSKPITIHSVQVANRVYPMPVTATFDCDDAYLNKLWDMSRQTLQLCSLDVFVDCPWREQTLWVGDMLEESLFYLQLTADRKYTSHNLRMVAQGALPSGEIPARYPSSKDIFLPVISAKWIITLHDHWLHAGDLELVRELMPVVNDALAMYESWQDDDGLVPDQQGENVWNLVDWGYANVGVQMEGKTAALNMIIAGAFRLAGHMSAAIGDTDTASQRADESKRMVAAMIDVFWDEQGQHLRDCTAPVNGRDTFSQVPHAVGLCYDLLLQSYQAGALEALSKPGTIECEFSYTMALLDALSRGGRADIAMKIIHSHWQMMVDAGSSTLWEVRDGRASMTGCGSLCHGFTSTPLYFAQTVLLGVKVAASGFSKFTFNPQHLGIQRAVGTVPTPHGLIKVAWKMVGDEMKINLQVPQGTNALLPDGRELGAGVYEL